MDIEDGRHAAGTATDQDVHVASPSASGPSPAPALAARKSKSKSKSTTNSWLTNLRDDVHASYSDLPVLACCAVSGLCDSVAFNAGGVFVSMQTGNTIFLALGASQLPAGEPHLWLKALASIAAFWLGCFVFSKSRHLHPQRKATLSLSFFIQAAFIFIAAALSQAHVVPSFAGALLGTSDDVADKHANESDIMIFAPLILLGFQFGGQIVTSRILGFNEVPTNVLTSVYCDLLSDPKMFAPISANPKRNRRLAAVVILVAGGIAGGWLQRTRAGMSAALWIAGGIKLAIAVAWLMWNGKQVSRDEK